MPVCNIGVCPKPARRSVFPVIIPNLPVAPGPCLNPCPPVEQGEARRDAVFAENQRFTLIVRFGTLFIAGDNFRQFHFLGNLKC